jgi:hypothetical protein
MRKLLVGLSMTVYSGLAQAIDGVGGYWTLNNTTCGQYMEERKNTKSVAYAQTAYWVSGYISAYNRWTPDTYNILAGSDIHSVMQWLENYCRTNPMKNLANGMDDLMVELHPRRLREGKR